jgi:hypothetical protein
MYVCVMCAHAHARVYRMQRNYITYYIMGAAVYSILLITQVLSTLTLTISVRNKHSSLRASIIFMYRIIRF